MFDELLRRIHTVTDVFPADTPITPSLLRNDFGDGVALLREIATALEGIADLTEECVEVVYERRQTYIRFVRHIESEGYAVDTDTFTTVTDPKDWSVLDGVDDPDLRVQLEAEKIARAEQAAVYQQRLEGMDAAIKKDRIRVRPSNPCPGRATDTGDVDPRRYPRVPRAKTTLPMAYDVVNWGVFPHHREVAEWMDAYRLGVPEVLAGSATWATCAGSFAGVTSPEIATVCRSAVAVAAIHGVVAASHAQFGARLADIADHTQRAATSYVVMDAEQNTQALEDVLGGEV